MSAQVYCSGCNRYEVACICPKPKEPDTLLRAMMEHADETMNFNLYKSCKDTLEGKS